MSFTEFLNQYNGQEKIGDTPENIGQCVGLVEKWIDVLRLPHVWGNAIDLLTNADSAYYVKVPNTPTNAPSEGDIVVFGSPYGEYKDSAGIIHYYGHTGIATSNCTDAILELLEQNDPIDSPTHIKTYNYKSCLGWLHPKVLPNTVNQEVQPTIEQIQSALQTQITATSTCQTQLKSATDQITALQLQLQTENGKVLDLTKNISDLQLKYDADQNEIILLNTTIETQAKSNKDYASEVLTAQHEVAELAGYLYAHADALGIKTMGLKYADIAEKDLAEINGIDQLGVAQAAKIRQLQNPNNTSKPIQETKNPSLLRRFIWLFIKQS